MNNLYEKKTQSELASFFTCNMFQPCKINFNTNCKNGKFETWPGLAAELIAANLQKPEATVLGHLDQTRKTQIRKK